MTVRSPRLRLMLHPWSRSAGAEVVELRFKVDIEIVSIPDNAWDMSSAETLLAPFCDIEHLAPKTRDGSDMFSFRLTAWTTNPDAIPRSSELLVREPDAIWYDADPNRTERLFLRANRRPVRIFVTLSLRISAFLRHYRHHMPTATAPTTVHATPRPVCRHPSRGDTSSRAGVQQWTRADVLEI